MDVDILMDISAESKQEPIKEQHQQQQQTQEISRACLELATGFQHLREAIDNLQDNSFLGGGGGGVGFGGFQNDYGNIMSDLANFMPLKPGGGFGAFMGNPPPPHPNFSHNPPPNFYQFPDIWDRKSVYQQQQELPQFIDFMKQEEYNGNFPFSNNSNYSSNFNLNHSSNNSANRNSNLHSLSHHPYQRNPSSSRQHQQSSLQSNNNLSNGNSDRKGKQKVTSRRRSSYNAPANAFSAYTEIAFQRNDTGVWSEKQRRKLNEVFIRYYERRKEFEPISYGKLADELLELCSNGTPSITHLDKQLGRYLMGYSVSKDPVVLEAIQAWIEKEIQIHGAL
ncbi:12243_t:CDS:2 [Ambispora gerdemannii]|uniref:12243_t:CDS:1 n=1 Tax=Ambispora gerdemannii TaxID=144530 RepID=A0A9N8Z1B9_9GLOM|nr:12243_t:CDS:2 [Ambispora gerdemannii]